MAGARDERVVNLCFEPAPADPFEQGVVNLRGNDIVAWLGGQLKSLTGGLDPAGHRQLDQLIHLISENSFEEVTYGAGLQVTNITVWTDAGKTVKIREEQFTYIGNKVTQIVTIQYDAAGVVIVGETMTETLTYTGNQLDDITRVMT